MRYMIYEDDLTHRFAFLPLPARFVDGDPLPVIAIARWFDTHAEAIASLPELFDRDESEPEGPVDAASLLQTVSIRHDPDRPH
jgi:hypothetical protein